LILADLQTLELRLEKARRAAKSGESADRERIEALEKVQDQLDAGRPARAAALSEREQTLLREAPIVDNARLLTMKPVLYVANVAEDDLAEDAEHVRALREEADRRGGRVMTVCADLEAELAELDGDDQREMLGEFGVEEPALHELIREVYALLGLRSFFTAGSVEIRAWTIRQGATAAEAADAIHSDIRRSFIRAEVYRLEDLRRHGDPAALRDAGDVRVEGEEYVVRDGDIMFFRHDA